MLISNFIDCCLRKTVGNYELLHLPLTTSSMFQQRCIIYNTHIWSFETRDFSPVMFLTRYTKSMPNMGY